MLFFTSITLKAQIVDTLVDVGGYNLYFNIIKGVDTTIIFEAGAGEYSSCWEDILDSISYKTGATLITYDRSGFGKSGILEKDMNILDEIIGLEKGLDQLGYTQKYLLVGHSYGGFCSTLFAFRNPDKIIGYIAIDANLPCIFNKPQIKLINEYFLTKRDSLKNSDIGYYNLLLSFKEDLKIMEESPLPLNIPVIDIFAEKQKTDSTLKIDCHKKFVSLSEKRQLIIAKNCGHYIFNDDPHLIIKTISDFYIENKE
jgi:pimeloyl-ACP methyl ester carboxylesterase